VDAVRNDKCVSIKTVGLFRDLWRSKSPRSPKQAASAEELVGCAGSQFFFQNKIVNTHEGIFCC
jgi:hypothetical protein